MHFTLQDTYNLGSSYAFALSGGINQGIPLGDGRKVGIDNDQVLQGSLTSPASIGLSNNVGVLNASSQATVNLAIPNIPSIANVTVYGTFITYDSSGQIVSIADPINFTII